MSTIKIPSHVNTKKARVRKSESSDWNWEDEMLMYDVSNRSSEVKKLRREKEEKSLKTKEEEDEVKRIAKEKETELLYMREERKLFLGGLAPETIEKDLRKHFSQFGQLVDVQVMRDREQGGISRGFGFVTFACSFMAETALEQKEHILNGKKIEPKYATPDIPRYKRTIPELEAQMDEECKNKRSIFVGALKDTIGEEDLVRYFSGFGKVIRAVKIYDKETGNKKTFGFVDFADFGIVRKVMNVTKHYIQGKRIRVELSRPRIEFSHQTKTVFVGGLEDGIDDPELYKYFSEFGFVTRALRIPNKDEPKRKFGFVDFDDYDAVDIVVSQREHFIDGHRLRVELALPLINDSLYEKDVVVPGETWMEKVQRKLQFAIPDQGTWGTTMNNYEIFVKGGPDVKTVRFKIPRGMLEYVVGMAGKVIEEIANDTNTRVVVKKPSVGAKNVIFTVTGKSKDVMSAQYIFQQIVKSNIHKLNTVRPITNS
ncbi:uncharacterized protein [Lepeophtheirus salmonis]|uniref:RNAbinding protein Musashi homolog Rbp6like [Oryzias latipes] n=1 Tax=Lepeophtheirus salmonis TaxID=72036 RepID=A0A0K2UX60_LEPSM|nr:protein gar2-like [Lepeophtheirus salmonis]